MDSFHLASEDGKYFGPETVFLKNMNAAVNLIMHLSCGYAGPGIEKRNENSRRNNLPVVCVPFHPTYIQEIEVQSVV